jgi:DNA-binding response OmpR family regulator
MYPEAVQRRKILLAGGTWRPRALILAQLKEEGYDVTAAETWDEAELLLRTHAVRSDATVFDVEGEGHPEAALATLGRLVGAPRVLVLTSPSQLPAATARSLGFEHVLARPYSVGDVVAAVRTLLAER